MDHGQLDGLLALKLVAEKKNFSAAARELGISPSAISQIIKQLEQRVGLALLTRTTRSTQLTEAGEQFLIRAGPAIEQIISALAAVGNYAAKTSGLLRINCPRVIYPSYLAPIVSGFTKKHPEVCVEIFFDDQTSDIVAQGFDAGIRLSDILANDVVAIKLFGPIKFVVAGAPKYLNRLGRPKHPKDLLDHNCIRLRFGPTSLYDRWEFEHRGQEFQVQVKGSLILNDSLVMRQTAVDGSGLIYTTQGAVADLVKAGKLEIVLQNYATSSAGFYLYYPQRSQVQPKLRAFIDYLKAWHA